MFNYCKNGSKVDVWRTFGGLSESQVEERLNDEAESFVRYYLRSWFVETPFMSFSDACDEVRAAIKSFNGRDLARRSRRILNKIQKSDEERNFYKEEKKNFWNVNDEGENYE